ncbi:ATP-grasp domain-containing protein [Actinacidiphila acididurans]|uniref:ATP-grasp domain-containing protein n=1 Tax=Actinacidiphila acididurans TaxID=2784346 RepID=A0ABS2U3A1_9ACTN|nr:ATP-grasp domain-containing protein [Actinacidiphila acididurans]MBM9510078.1 ATP-grasp domain-containing protein [Actinacidiphila acididurans]
MPKDGDRPLLLLIGSSSRLSRKFVLETVSRKYALWLLQPAPVTWEAPYVVGSTQVDNTDPARLTEAARAVAAEHRVSGVFCYDEGLVTPAAHAAQALGLPGTPPEAIAACRDKNRTRTLLDEGALRQPASVAVGSLTEAAAAADKIGYPVVLKPRGLAGSMGVRGLAGPEDLADAWAAASAASYPGVPVFELSVLVEKFVDGPEISVDAVFWDGGFQPLVVAHKRVGLAPYFEEFGHEIDGADPLLSDPAVTEALRRSHAALGFHTGVTHTEFRLAPDGPHLMEVNARIGGDMIPYLGHLSGAPDVALAAADVAAGVEPDLTRTSPRAAAVTFLYPEHDIEVESVTVRQDRFTPDVHSADPLTAPGAVLRLPPRGYISRYGRVIALADTVDATRRALSRAPELVELAAHPAPPEPR